MGEVSKGMLGWMTCACSKEYGALVGRVNSCSFRAHVQESPCHCQPVADHASSLLYAQQPGP